MQISGKVIQVLNLEQGVGKASGKEWKKQTFVLSVYYSDNEREASVPLTLWGDKCDNTPQVGQQVTVDFDINGREYNGKWYVELKAWRVTRRDEGAAPAVMQNAPSGNQWQTVAQAQQNGTMPQPVQGNDLPF